MLSFLLSAGGELHLSSCMTGNHVGLNVVSDWQVELSAIIQGDILAFKF